MLNREIAWHLQTISVLMELNEENQFRVRAFANAGREVKRLSRPVTAMLEDGSLEHVQGIGPAILKSIRELSETGKSTLLDELMDAVPPALVELGSIPGIGAKTARTLLQHLGVQNISELEAAAEAGKVRQLPGFGEKKERTIRSGIELLRSRGSLSPIGICRPIAESLVSLMRQSEWVSVAEIAGRVRRWQELNADIDLVAVASDGERLGKFLEQIRGIELDEVLPDRILLNTGIGISVRIWLVASDKFALSWLRYTGAKEHITALEERGELAGANEDEIYANLGLHLVPPERRQPGQDLRQYSIDLPEPDLVVQAQIWGDLHLHSQWSDGVLEIDELARLCHRRGYEYIAITDHSPSLAIARGLPADKLALQLAEIQNRQHQYPLTVLTGVEVDIRSDGSLDLPDSVLSKLDWVIASVHSNFRMGREQMTDRIVAAMANPHVCAIGHASGRLLQRRPGYELNWERLLTAASRYKVALEVNSSPDRLDINDELIARAIDKGVKVVINTDAHSRTELDNMRYGVATARRAGARSADILNCMSLEQLTRYLRSRA